MPIDSSGLLLFRISPAGDSAGDNVGEKAGDHVGEKAGDNVGEKAGDNVGEKMAGVEVLIGHMGGPFWARKNDHAWSVPKGLHDEGEDDHLAVAEREFEEEMGSPAPPGETLELGTVKSGNKRVTVFAREGAFDAAAAVSNTFDLEWPKGSGTIQTFPEMDCAEWVPISHARTLLVKSQVPILDRLLDRLFDRLRGESTDSPATR